MDIWKWKEKSGSNRMAESTYKKSKAERFVENSLSYNPQNEWISTNQWLLNLKPQHMKTVDTIQKSNIIVKHVGRKQPMNFKDAYWKTCSLWPLLTELYDHPCIWFERVGSIPPNVMTDVIPAWAPRLLVPTYVIVRSLTNLRWKQFSSTLSPARSICLR